MKTHEHTPTTPRSPNRAGGAGARQEEGKAGSPARRAADTEGGEALIPAAADRSGWHVLWTRSHCEEMVHDQLLAKGFHPFLPRFQVWSRRRGRPHRVSVPMFPGYLFVNDLLDKPAHVEVRKSRGLVGILGEGWDRPAVVPSPEVDAIRSVVAAQVPALAHPFLREGRRVRIVDGPLRDVEGILVQAKADRGLVVLSVDLLQRSVAVEVDASAVVPA
jgi:transcription termination/antitermination protein NusG